MQALTLANRLKLFLLGKNPKTSLIGWVIVGFTLLRFTGKIDTDEYITLVTLLAGFGFWKSGDGSRIRVFLPLMLLTSLSGCVTYQRCQEKFGHLATDSLEITRTIVERIPRDTAALTLPTNFACNTLPIYLYASQGRATVTLSRPAPTPSQPRPEMVVQAECKPVTITKTITVKAPPRIIFKPQYGFWRWAAGIGWGLLLLLLALLWIDRRTTKAL